MRCSVGPGPYARYGVPQLWIKRKSAVDLVEALQELRKKIHE